MPWYDTKEGIEARLTSLSGLHEIMKARRSASQRGELLHEFCILGRFWLDPHGRFNRLEKGAPAEGHAYFPEGLLKSYDYAIPSVMTRETAYQFTGNISYTLTRNHLPAVGAECDRCGKEWNLRNLHDYYEHEGTTRHLSCHHLALIDRERDFFQKVFVQAEVPYSSFDAIPSQYHDDDTYYGPWFMVHTDKGRIQIGWRRRVVELEWSRTGLDAQGSDIVADPEVTHGSTFVHCWGEDETVKALRKLWHGS